MASISFVSSTTTTATFEVTGLSSAWNSSNFTSCGLTSTEFTSTTGATSVSNKKWTENAPSSGTSTSFQFTMTGLDPGKSYTYYGWIYVKSTSKYYTMGKVTFSTQIEYADATLSCLDLNTKNKVRQDDVVVKNCRVGGTITLSTYAPDDISNYEYVSSNQSNGKLTIKSGGSSAKLYYAYTGTTSTSFSLTSTKNTISVSVTNIDARAPWIEVVCYETNNTSKHHDVAYQQVSGTTKTIPITGLSENTQYTVGVRYSPDGDTSGTYVKFDDGSTSKKIKTASDVTKYTLTYKCVNRHKTSSYVGDGTYTFSVNSGESINVTSMAPEIPGWELYGCDQDDISSVTGNVTITAQYEKKVTAVVQYYKNGSLVTADTKNIAPLVGGELDLSHANYKNNYESSGYYFRRVVITVGNKDTEYTAPPTEYEVPDSDITIKYYYVSLCKVTTKHYINNDWQDDDDLTFNVDYGHITTPATWSQIKTDENYSDCTFSKVVMGSTTYNIGSTDTYTFTGDVTCKFYYTRATVQYNLTYKYLNYHNTEKSVADTYTTSVASGTQISITKDNAPTIDGWEFKSCKPSSPFSVSADTEIILYYAKYVTLTLQYYKDGKLAETADPKQAGYQGPFTPTHSDWRKDNEASYSNYTFQYAEIDGTKYYSTDEKYEIPDHDVVVKYYYAQTSGNKAQLIIRYLEEETEQELADPYENFNLDWNSATFGNSVDLSATNSSTGAYVYRKDIDGYTFSRYDLGDYPRPEKGDPYYKENAVYFTSPDLYEVSIYYKKATSGYGATIKINYLELATNNVLADPYQKSNLAWNSETWDNRVDLYGIDNDTGKYAYIKEIEGYTCVDYSVGSYDRPLASDPKYIATAVYFRAKTDYEAALYYAKKATTINITTEHICDDDGTVFWTDPNSPYTGVIGFTYAPAHTNYRYPGLDYVFQYAQIQGNDIKYTHPDSSIPVTADTGNLHVVYHYTKAKEASFYVSQVTSTSFELTVELTKPFTSDNYRRLIFTATPGGYDTAFLAWTVDEAARVNNTSNIQTVGTDKNGRVLDASNNPYIVYCYAQAKNGEYFLVYAINSEGIKSDYAEVYLLSTNVTEGVYGKWCAFFNTQPYPWSNSNVDFEITFNELYPFCSQYFTEVGIVQEEFIVPSEALPGIPLVSTPATDMQTTVVQMSITGLLSGTLQSAYFYVQTLDGMYVPIPFGIDGAYGKVTATKPDMLYYNNVPTTGQPVNLLASDIHTFIDAVDRTARWVFDSTEEAYITRSSVAQGEPIYASTFNGLASFIDSVSGSVSFESAFQYVNAGDCITASNLNALPEALNNMLGVL